jgi:Family of unknown function (DUF5677)
MEAWKEIRQEAEMLFNRHYDRCIDLLPLINFSINNFQHTVSLCLYCSVVELCPSLLLLINKGQFIGVPQLIRSMYEAGIDLSNTLNNRDYPNALYASYLTKTISVIQEAYKSKAAGFTKTAGGREAMKALLKYPFRGYGRQL